MVALDNHDNQENLGIEALVSETPVSSRSDYTIDQNWSAYTREEHDVWKALYHRQCAILPGLVVPEFFEGLDLLHMDENHIPEFGALNEKLMDLTQWQVVAVPDLVPDNVFFEHLANRRFPAGRFIRRREQLDYLQEPDIFHDVFGHVPLLANPFFADYMEAYGKGGLRALGRNVLNKLARLYWYTVEFGLMETDEGLRIYGAGIASSKTESLFSLKDPSPHRLKFDLMRLLRTNYKIDDFQQVYFVIDDFKQLFDQTLQDFSPIYDALETLSDLAPADVVRDDDAINIGTQIYASSPEFKTN
jgi:phenylalanine-4-hydroxylase